MGNVPIRAYSTLEDQNMETTLYDEKTDRIETWIGQDLITIDLGDLWLQTFCHWEALVDTHTAETLANAVVNTLREPSRGAHTHRPHFTR